jgi:hypothetical protein
MTRSDASDGLGGRPGSTDNIDREQADKGEGNEDSSLHGAFFPVDWGPDRKAGVSTNRSRRANWDDTASYWSVRCDMQHIWQLGEGMTRSGRERIPQKSVVPCCLTADTYNWWHSAPKQDRRRHSLIRT